MTVLVTCTANEASISIDQNRKDENQSSCSFFFWFSVEKEIKRYGIVVNIRYPVHMQQQQKKCGERIARHLLFESLSPPIESCYIHTYIHTYIQIYITVRVSQLSMNRLCPAKKGAFVNAKNANLQS